jgi:hypothetical protein
VQGVAGEVVEWSLTAGRLVDRAHPLPRAVGVGSVQLEQKDGVAGLGDPAHRPDRCGGQLLDGRRGFPGRQRRDVLSRPGEPALR